MAFLSIKATEHKTTELKGVCVSGFRFVFDLVHSTANTAIAATDIDWTKILLDIKYKNEYTNNSYQQLFSGKMVDLHRFVQMMFSQRNFAYENIAVANNLGLIARPAATSVYAKNIKLVDIRFPLPLYGDIIVDVDMQSVFGGNLSASSILKILADYSDDPVAYNYSVKTRSVSSGVASDQFMLGNGIACVGFLRNQYTSNIQTTAVESQSITSLVFTSSQYAQSYTIEELLGLQLVESVFNIDAATAAASIPQSLVVHNHEIVDNCSIAVQFSNAASGDQFIWLDVDKNKNVKKTNKGGYSDTEF